MGSPAGSRRVSLARAIYTQPDILLLDEPTNHMDLPTIEWMEKMLRQLKGALLVVSHDRAFLRNLGTGIIWLHGGKLRRRDGRFDEFESWSDGILADEAVALQLDRHIAAETEWSRKAFQHSTNAIKGGFVISADCAMSALKLAVLRKLAWKLARLTAEDNLFLRQLTSAPACQMASLGAVCFAISTC